MPIEDPERRTMAQNDHALLALNIVDSEQWKLVQKQKM